MPRIAHILASLEAADGALRFRLVGQLGQIRRRKLRSGQVAFFLDFRPYGRVWSHRGVQITDEATAQRLIEQIRGKVEGKRSLEEVLAEYLPKGAKANLVSTWLNRWLEVRRREAQAGSLSLNWLQELERLCEPGGHFSFFADTSIFEITYGTLEDFSLWLADREIAPSGRRLSPKSRRAYLATFQAFLRWLQRRGELRDVPRAPTIKVPEHEPRIIGFSDQQRVLDAIPEDDRGIFIALAYLGLRPGEARAVTVADYHDGWITIDKAAKTKNATAPIGPTKSGKGKRLPVPEPLVEWIEKHVDPAGRLRSALLFPNPRTGSMWAHKAMQSVWHAARKRAELPHISLYEGTKHSFATDAIRRGVPERHLQRFLGHASLVSTRRYARLADNAMLEVLRPRYAAERQASDKGLRDKPEQNQAVKRGPSWIRTRVSPVMSRVL